MDKRGYRSYHGRMSAGKRIAIIVMVAILLLATVYLVSQHFTVYDDAGGIHIRWPFSREEEQTEEDELPPEHDDLQIIIGTKEETAVPEEVEEPLAPLRGFFLTGDISLADHEDRPFVITVKDAQGRLQYPSTLISAQNAEAVVGDEADGAALEAMSQDYGVALISAVRDNYYPLYRTELAGLCREGGYPWRAFDACYYLDPAKSTARSYVSSVAEESISLGFDEVLLSDIGYPAEGEGRLYRILYPEEPRAAVKGMMTAVGGAVRRAGAVFSVELEAKTVLDGSDEVRGIYLEDALAAADRIYVRTTEAEAIALAKQIGDAADFVAVFAEEPSADYTGNYMIVK